MLEMINPRLPIYHLTIISASAACCSSRKAQNEDPLNTAGLILTGEPVNNVSVSSLRALDLDQHQISAGNTTR